MLKNSYQIVTKHLILTTLFCCFFALHSSSQFLMDAIDTTKDLGKSMFSVLKNFNHIRISGYLQPQFQVASAVGAKNYSGGDFQPYSNNRFMLRRGRFRIEYGRFNKNNQLELEFCFQTDGTERGVVTRDFWGRYFDNKYQYFAITAGIFARPFGYELNLSSVDRESPERGRMSQILMRTERDIGAMISIEPRKPNHPLKMLKLDIGFFNGQGLPATADYDSYKDLIARFRLKPINVQQHLRLSAGVSYLNGGHYRNNKYSYTTVLNNGNPTMVIDSSQSNISKKAPRLYYGADAQLLWIHKKSTTEFRAEYWRGTQTATNTTSETPTVLLNEPYYIRKFDGAFFYALHTFNKKYQIGLKLDWYDPNVLVKGQDIGKAGSLFNATDIKYTTFGIGFTRHINENLKLVLWYDRIVNEATQLANYTTDVSDNIFTTRLQFRF